MNNTESVRFVMRVRFVSLYGFYEFFRVFIVFSEAFFLRSLDDMNIKDKSTAMEYLRYTIYDRC